MPNSRHRSAARGLERLFSEGSLSALPDSALLQRFVLERDEYAFAAIVDRHGAMVHSVCRAILVDPRDVEDAFQVTFMVLARSARLIWCDGTLGGWLYRVARRVAIRSRSQFLSRRRREAVVPALELDRAIEPEPRERDFQMLHEAIDRLPEKYRGAVVLCYLEGMTQTQAATALGCGEATLRRRLAGARERLRSWLSTNRADSLLVLVTGSASDLGCSSLTAPLVESTIQAAMEFVGTVRVSAGSRVVSESVVNLSRGVLKMMIVQSLKWPLIGSLVAAGVIGTAVLAQPGQTRVPAQAKQQAFTPVEAAAKPEKVEQVHKQPDLQAMTRRIHQCLDQRIDLDLGVVELGQVFKAIINATRNDTNTGIAIYVDANGLHEAEDSVARPVSVRCKQTRVRDILNETLGPKLRYAVKDGYLTISSTSRIVDSRLDEIESKLDRVLEALERLDRK